MRAAVSWATGVCGTVVMMLLLGALAPAPDRRPGARPSEDAARVLARAPSEPREERPTPRPSAARAFRAPGARGPGGRGPGEAGGGRAERARPAASELPSGGLTARRAGTLPVAWPEGPAWPGATLAGVSVAGAGRGTGGDPDARPGGGGAPARPLPPPRPAGVTRRAVPEYTPQPAYPAPARARGESAYVEALVRIDASGAVTSVEVVGGSGHSAFESAVRGTVSRWRFSPALRDGVPVPTTIRRRFEFRMVDG